jgi:hypothetical protein
VKMAATASSLRLTFFLLLRKAPYTNTPPIIDKRRWSYFRCCSFSHSPSPSPQPSSWQPFRKKKVVMRIAYVGTNYRGQFQLSHTPYFSNHSQFILLGSYSCLFLMYFYFSFRSPNATG